MGFLKRIASKMSKPQVRLFDNVTVEHIRNGKVIHKQTVHNVVTQQGKEYCAGLFNGAQTSVFKYIAIGTSASAFTSTWSALGSELSASGTARTSGTPQQTSGTTSSDTAQVQVTFTYTGAGVTAAESGLFDSATSGHMACAQSFVAVPLASNDSLQVTWKVKMS